MNSNKNNGERVLGRALATEELTQIGGGWPLGGTGPLEDQGTGTGAENDDHAETDPVHDEICYSYK